MRMRASLILPAIPVLLFGSAWILEARAPKPAKPAARPETVRVIPLDTRTFADRFSASSQLPIMETKVRTIRIPGAIEPLPEPKPESRPEPEPRAKPAPRTKQRHSDICSRHGMRRINYGKRWRCR